MAIGTGPGQVVGMNSRGRIRCGARLVGRVAFGTDCGNHETAFHEPFAVDRMAKTLDDIPVRAFMDALCFLTASMTAPAEGWDIANVSG